VYVHSTQPELKGLPEMKKLLSLAIVAAALGAAIGCDDKKTSPPKTPSTVTPANTTPSK
jgi:hypothetical protein